MNYFKVILIDTFYPGGNSRLSPEGNTSPSFRLPSPFAYRFTAPFRFHPSNRSAIKSAHRFNSFLLILHLPFRALTAGMVIIIQGKNALFPNAALKITGNKRRGWPRLGHRHSSMLRTLSFDPVAHPPSRFSGARFFDTTYLFLAITQRLLITMIGIIA